MVHPAHQEGGGDFTKDKRGRHGVGDSLRGHESEIGELEKLSHGAGLAH